jgi:xanthine dehydrogenase YagR molybdenum-binding subunit
LIDAPRQYRLGALSQAAELDHRDGRIVNANIADCLVPVNADMPESA